MRSRKQLLYLLFLLLAGTFSIIAGLIGTSKYNPADAIFCILFGFILFGIGAGLFFEARSKIMAIVYAIIVVFFIAQAIWFGLTNRYGTMGLSFILGIIALWAMVLAYHDQKSLSGWLQSMKSKNEG